MQITGSTYIQAEVMINKRCKINKLHKVGFEFDPKPIIRDKINGHSLIEYNKITFISDKKFNTGPYFEPIAKIVLETDIVKYILNDVYLETGAIEDKTGTKFYYMYKPTTVTAIPKTFPIYNENFD